MGGDIGRRLADLDVPAGLLPDVQSTCWNFRWHGFQCGLSVATINHYTDILPYITALSSIFNGIGRSMSTNLPGTSGKRRLTAMSLAPVCELHTLLEQLALRRYPACGRKSEAEETKLSRGLIWDRDRLFLRMFRLTIAWCWQRSSSVVTTPPSSRSRNDSSLLNVSYDPTRELYQDFNPAFAKHWAKRRARRSPWSRRTAARASRRAA